MIYQFYASDEEICSLGVPKPMLVLMFLDMRCWHDTIIYVKDGT